MDYKDYCRLSQVVRQAYKRGEEDETLLPVVLAGPDGSPIGRIKKGDSVIFYNIRGEREIELTESLTAGNFGHFRAETGLGLDFATMIQYSASLPVKVAFPPEDVVCDTLFEILAANSLKVAKITEAEKAVHVSFFLNGKRQEPFPGEQRVVVPTRKDVALFDEAPEMSIDGIRQAISDKVQDKSFDLILANYPNVDVVGHIENEPAVLRAVEAVDKNAGLSVQEALESGMTVIITADHGTVERWLYPDGAVDTGHTNSPVPFILINPEAQMALRPKGELADIAPTVLEMLGIDKPGCMTGRSLLKKHPEKRPGRVLFLILDGWGYNPEAKGNLIASAKTPSMDRFLKEYPSSVLEAAGEAVGLPAGTVGNSEVGHLHIGSGRRVYSDRVRIDQAIADGSFFKNEAFLEPMRRARDANASLHLMGIVSFFSSHGSVNHLLALMEMAARERVKEVYIHAMLGRRGELPESGANYIEMVEKKAAELKLGKVVSVIGRYWSMDREENWDRIEKTYRMLVYGEGRLVKEVCQAWKSK